jgi:glycosyltransferase involved in cell wall biosynthesis
MSLSLPSVSFSNIMKMFGRGKRIVSPVRRGWRTFIIAAFSLSVGYLLFRSIMPWLYQPANIGSTVVRYEEENTKRVSRVGMLTLYGITPGGGERYLLTSARAFQLQGFHVDILVKSDNKCKTIKFLRATAEFLRIELDYRKLSLRVIRLKGYRITKTVHSYDIFYMLGNEKFPQAYGIGKNLNIYMCQFPFDLDRPGDEAQLNVIQDYDIVLVNSLYTLGWYAKLIQPTFNQLQELGRKTPSVHILYPPVDPFIAPLVISQLSKEGSNLSSPAEVIKIVLLGRFFSGRQNKGHKVAIKLLEQLRTQSKKNFEMTLIGNIHPSPEAKVYVEDLRSYVATRHLPVIFLTNAQPSDIAEKLAEATAFWHLTGIKDEFSGAVDDPASLEHFGIAVVEAMSMGCIPIVLNVGGTVDIVEHGKNGFLAKTAADYVTHTLSLASMSVENLQIMKSAAVKKSKKFHVSGFISKLQLIAHRAVLSYPLRRVAYFMAAKMAKVSQGDMRLVVRAGPDAHTRLGTFLSTIVPKRSYQRLPVSCTSDQYQEGEIYFL